MLLSASSIWGSSKQPSLSSVFNRLGFESPELGSMQVVRDVTRIENQKSVRTITATSSERSVEVELLEPVSEAEAVEYEESRLRSVELLYEQQVSPYQGDVSYTVSCPPSMKARRVTVRILGNETPVLVANANDRDTFGICDPATVKKVGLFAVVRDSTARRVLRFKIFAPSKGFSQERALKALLGLRRRAS